MIDPTSSFNIGTTAQGNIINTMYIEGTTTAGFIPATPRSLFNVHDARHVVSTHDQWPACPVTANTTQPVLGSADTTDKYLCDVARRIRLNNATQPTRSTTTRHALVRQSRAGFLSSCSVDVSS